MAIKCPKCQSENTDAALFCSNCASSLNVAEDAKPAFTKTLETPVKRLTIGSIFAKRYEILEELGKGGMGEVYRVKDEKLDEEMALKVLKPEIAAFEGTIERFKNELKLARKIGHKNVCRMYDLNEEEETPFITMEYVKGEDLKSFIRGKGRLTQEEAITIAKQVCEGLAGAHELGVIHRDLKPQNIMINEKGSAKVMDFGIARSVEAAGVTQTGMMIGTPDYMSPEQAEGEEADQRSDIYSLGVILYEMVTGNVPFRGDTALSVALKHKAQLPQDPRKLNPDISENLGRLILICMEKDRNRRFQTAAELLADLKNIEEGFPLGTKIRPRRETFLASLIRKKLFVPALVVALAIIAVVIWQIIIQKSPSLIPLDKPSIAVLPFDDLSPEKDQGHLCEGLAETLITAFSQIENLYVPARTSAFSFKGKEKKYQEIGEKLNVKAVLEGSIQKSGNQLRIAARIIDVSDGSQIWGKSYTGEERDIFDIQDQISMEIVNNLNIELLGGEEAKLTKRYTENSEAYNLYMQGRYFLDKWEFGKSLEYFRKAIEKDPTYALAYASIGWNYNLLGYGTFLSPKEAYPRAKEAAEKALEIDNTLGFAHNVLGTAILLYYWDWEGAEWEIKRSIELNPNNANIHNGYALYLSAMGRYDEALAESKRAIELDPLSFEISMVFGMIFTYKRQNDRAIEQYKKILEMDPNFFPALQLLAMVYAYSGMYDEAIAEAKKELELWGPNQETLPTIGIIYAKSGKKDKAKDILDELLELEKQRYVAPTYFAAFYGYLGEMDQAFRWLEKAYEERDQQMHGLKVWPLFDPLRSDPRFKAMLKKMNLE